MSKFVNKFVMRRKNPMLTITDEPSKLDNDPTILRRFAEMKAFLEKHPIPKEIIEELKRRQVERAKRSS